MFGVKKKIAEIILSAELTGARSGVDRIEILSEYAKQIKDKRAKEEIEKIASKLKRGERYSQVYKPYLSAEVVKLVELAESKGLPVAVMVQEYVPVKKTVEDLERSLKAQVKVPFVVFGIVVLVFSFVLRQFDQIQKSGVELSDFSQLIIKFYLFFMLALGLFFFLVLWKFPHKTPIIGRVYKELRAIIGLAVAKTGYKMGLSSADLVPMLKRYYQVEGRYSPDVSGLLSLLSPYLSEFDRAEIVIAVKYGKVEEKLSELAEVKFKNVDYLKKTIDGAVDSLTKILIGIPILPPVLVYLDLLIKVSSKVG